MQLRGILVGIIFLSLALSFPKTARSEKANKLEHISVATASTQISTHSTPYLMGIRQGYFKKEGLEVEFIAMKGILINMTFGSGKLEYTASISHTINFAAMGLPVRLVFAIAHTRPVYLVSQKNITAIADLKGKTIGIGSIPDTGYFGTKKVLSHYGFDPDKDVTFLAVGPNKLPIIFSGSADVVYVTEDDAIFLKKKGYNLLVKVSDIWPATSLGLGVQQKKIKDNPQEVKRILRGLMKGQIYVLENRQKIIDLMIKERGYDIDSATQGYDLSLSSFTRNGIMPEGNVEKQIETARGIGLKVKEGITAPQIVDYSLLKEVLTELGISY